MISITQKRIEEILFDYDFIGLRFAGCPSDEYQPEAKMIFDRLNEPTDIESLGDLIYEIFLKMFSPMNIKRQMFDNVAEYIWKEINANWT